jgi:calcium/proton exchanger (cax)
MWYDDLPTTSSAFVAGREVLMNILRYMLIFVPIAFLAEWFFPNPLLVFALSCIALIPLAGLLGEATEELAIHVGPKVGGLLNATLGNAAELIITIVALREGKIKLVKASITGSIPGNLLLIPSLSPLPGDLRPGIQTFDRNLTGVAATMMTLSVVGMMIPTLFELLRDVQSRKSVDGESNWLEGVQLLAVYLITGLGFFFVVTPGAHGG